MENKIKETTEKLKDGTITKDESDKILLDLFNVMQRSEQLFYECPNNFDIYQETKIFHTSSNKEVKIIRTK